MSAASLSAIRTVLERPGFVLVECRLYPGQFHAVSETKQTTCGPRYCRTKLQALIQAGYLGLSPIAALEADPEGVTVWLAESFARDRAQEARH
jgi:hypothetical protein